MARFSRNGRFPRFSRKRRFRKQRAIWIPVLGTEILGSEEVYHSAAFSGAQDRVETDRSSGPVTSFFPIVPDFTAGSESSGDRGTSLHDRAQGNNWMLHSIVGSLHLNCDDSLAAGAWKYVEVAAGFFVARSEQGDDASPDLFTEEIDPLNADNMSDPWIWQRSWILANPSSTAVLRDDFPISNVPYSGGDDRGTAVMTKSRRHIRREHRLWFTISSMGWDGEAIGSQAAQIDQPRVQYRLDVRIAGRIVNNGKGASSF